MNNVDPIASIQRSESSQTVLQQLCDITVNEQCQVQYHEHHRTCRKGFNGQQGCRLAKKSGTCNGTHCVYLETVIRKNSDDKDDRDQEDSSDIELNSTEIDRRKPVLYSASLKKKSNSQYYYRVDDPVVNHEHAPSTYQYNIRNPLQRTDPKLIVWELDRPFTDFNKESDYEAFDITQAVPETTDPRNVALMKQQIKSNIKACLSYENNTGANLYADDSKLWTWIDSVDYKVLLDFYKEFLSRLKTANEYVVDHNVPLFYCTGAHNNVLLLGATSQAKSAIFYIAPYISKGKMTLSACMTILEKARRDVDKFPSTASDANTKEHNAQYFITKILNKLNAYIELSDYQVAAMLLKLPQRITSDIYIYSDPHASIAFRNYMCAEQNRQLLNDRQFEQENDKLDRLEMIEEFGVVGPFFDSSEST